MAELKNVEIFAVGTWNEFKFVQEDLGEIIKNTNILIQKNELSPRVKLGHSTNQILEGQSDGDPRLGNVENFRTEDNKIVADLTNLPDIIFAAIQKERFTDVSVEMEHIKHFGWFIKAVSLLGADIPAVKTINDLQKFLKDDANDVEYSSNIKLACSEPIIINQPEKERNMPEDKNLLQLELDKRELERKLKEAQDKSSESEKELSKFREIENDRRFSAEKEKLLAPYKEQVKIGKLPPMMMNKLETAIDEQRQSFSENSRLMLAANIINDIAAAYNETLPAREQAHDAREDNIELSDVSKKVDIETRKIMASTNKDYIEASDAVFRANPELEREYIEWTNKISYKEV